MKVTEVRLDSVNLDEETYRISEDLDPPAIESSLRRIGQLNPVLLHEKAAAGSVIVCGFRRLRALRRLGQASVLARVLPAQATRPLETFRLAIWDNLSHRQFQTLEIARILFTLESTCGLPQDLLVREYLPLLGLPPHRKVLRSHLGLHALNAGLRAQLKDSRLTLAAASRLAAKPPSQQAAFAAALSAVRLTASMQRQFLDLVEEIAVRDNRTIQEILRIPEIPHVLTDGRLSEFQKGEQVCSILYRQRYPRISAAEARFAAEMKRLGLPGDVHLTHDRFFESPSIRVAFEVESPARFRALAAALDEASRSEGLDALFEASQNTA